MKKKTTAILVIIFASIIFLFAGVSLYLYTIFDWSQTYTFSMVPSNSIKEDENGIYAVLPIVITQTSGDEENNLKIEGYILNSEKTESISLDVPSSKVLEYISFSSEKELPYPAIFTIFAKEESNKNPIQAIKYLLTKQKTALEITDIQFRSPMDSIDDNYKTDFRNNSLSILTDENDIKYFVLEETETGLVADKDDKSGIYGLWIVSDNPEELSLYEKTYSETLNRSVGTVDEYIRYNNYTCFVGSKISRSFFDTYCYVNLLTDANTLTGEPSSAEDSYMGFGEDEKFETSKVYISSKVKLLTDYITYYELNNQLNQKKSFLLNLYYNNLYSLKTYNGTYDPFIWEMGLNSCMLSRVYLDDNQLGDDCMYFEVLAKSYISNNLVDLDTLDLGKIYLMFDQRDTLEYMSSLKEILVLRSMYLPEDTDLVSKSILNYMFNNE